MVIKSMGTGRGRNEGQMRIKIGGQGRPEGPVLRPGRPGRSSLTRPTIGLQRISASANLFSYCCI